MMEWINIFGAVFIAVIMVPNIIFTLKYKDGFENKWNNKGVEVVEQIGRFGCFGFMVVNIPGTWFGWWSDEAFAIYLIANVVLIILYCVIWIICFRNNTIFKALTLSIIPSVIFIFCYIYLLIYLYSRLYFSFDTANAVITCMSLFFTLFSATP